MPVINGTSGSDTLPGTNENDTINAFGGQDLVSGEGGDDSILGGNGNDTLFGDVGEGTAPGNDATPLIISSGNRVTGNSSDNEPGDFAVYRNVAQLEDGTQVSARIVLVSKSDDDLAVDLSGPAGAEILMNGDDTGETAMFRMEFFIPDGPDATMGTPVALNSTATVNDLDRNSPGNQESVTFDTAGFTQFATSKDTSLNVTTGMGTVTAAGTEQNNPSDQDAWFSASFENREFIEFTLEARTTNSGFSFSGDLIDDAVVTPIEAGDDTIEGGRGQDQIFGQGGNDSLIGGQGADHDRGEGGTGSDLFTFDGLGNHIIIGGEDADGLDIDVIDLTGVDANVIRTGPESGRIELLDQNGNVARRVEYSEIEQIICFTPGTRIATQNGQVCVEQLQAGDKVFTRDNGTQTLRWVGRRDLSPRELLARPHFRPVLIRKGVLGKGLPERDMLVSPQHRMLVTSDLAALMFDEREVLVAAKHLIGLDGVDPVQVGRVSYLHLMFDQHEVILADGAWSESFQPGEMSLRGIGADQREEVLGLFPELDSIGGLQSFGAARLSLKRHEAAVIVDRLL